MLDVKFIREDPKKVREGMRRRGLDPKAVDDFLALDEEWRKTVKELQELRAKHKQLSEALRQAKDKTRDVAGAKDLKGKIRDLEDQQKTLGTKRDDLLELIPNLPFDDVPLGKSEEDNKVLREVGERPQFDFKVRDHLDIGRALNLIDTEKAAEVSGSRFSYLKRDAVLLEFALVKLAFDTLLKEGFIPVLPPLMIRPEAYRGMGRLAGEQKEERYYLEKDDLYLIGSAEHTIGPLHMNEILDEKELPKRYLGFSTCFRREAGSYGRDVKGILRAHQFDKVEMFSFVKPEESEKEHAFLLSLQEKLMQKLRLPYRVVEMCTADIGWTDARQYDIETWLPAQGKYRETHSVSNTTDFQARGVNVRYRSQKPEAGGQELRFVHTLNATAFAIGRTLIAILENFQTKEGKVRVPKALQEYVGKEVIG